MHAVSQYADRDNLQGLPYRDNYPCKDIPVGRQDAEASCTVCVDAKAEERRHLAETVA